jgi:hypothetical protein
MSWHYRVRRREGPEKGKFIFDIVEMYNKPKGWTAEGMKPFGESKKELIWELETMLADAKKYPVLYDKEK